MRPAAVMIGACVLALSGCTRHCELHGDALRTDRLRTSYGLIRWPEGYLEAERAAFPHACTILPGGCFVDPEDTGLHRVWFCPTCRRAEATWEQDLEKRRGERHQQK